MSPSRLFAACLPAALAFSGCGVLSTHQSPKLLDYGEKAWTAGFGTGTVKGCGDSGFTKDCLLTTDPFWGLRIGGVAGPQDTARTYRGIAEAEVGIKFSGVPFLGGSFLADYRLRQSVEPVYLTWDFGVSFFPCFGVLLQSEDEDDDWDQEESGSVCYDQPYGGAVMAGATVGKPWLFAGFKYWLGGNSWQGWQSLPGFTLGSALGSRTFKVIPAASVYFPQFPFDTSPEMRIIAGAGIQKSF